MGQKIVNFNFLNLSLFSTLELVSYHRRTRQTFFSTVFILENRLIFAEKGPTINSNLEIEMSRAFSICLADGIYHQCNTGEKLLGLKNTGYFCFGLC